MQTWFSDRMPSGVINCIPTKVIMFVDPLAPNGEKDDIRLSEALLAR